MSAVAKAIHPAELIRRVDVAGIPRVDDHPAAVASAKFDEVTRLARVGDKRSVVLGSPAKDPRVALGDIEVIEHRDRQAVAAIGPGPAAVLADIEPAVIHAIDAPGLSLRHDEPMM